MRTEQDYYEDDDLHGKYQYVSLEDIINNVLLESQNEDSYLKNVKRYNLVRYAKDIISSLNQRSIDVKAFEITVPHNLVVVVPPDFVDYVRVSLIGPDGHLIPLEINRDIHTAIGYLQDHDLNLIFDQDGDLVTANSLNGYAKPYRAYKFASSCNNDPIFTHETYPNGTFTIDKRNGKILFSSDLMEKGVVVEYDSDGLSLDDSEITIQKVFRRVVEEGIYFRAIEKLRNVPANEKERARRMFKAERHAAMKKISDISVFKIKRNIK